MSASRSRSHGRRAAVPSLIPAALLLLLALVAALTYNARTAERSHRATAESALRDYAAFAAWEFARHTQDALASRIRGTLHRIRDIRLDAAGPLPPAAFLSPDHTGCSCGFGRDVRFAFRMDTRDGLLTTDGADGPGEAAALERLRPELTAAAREGLGRRDIERAEELSSWARVIVDTLAAKPHVVAFTVARDRSGSARAVYGVVADPQGVTKLFDCTMSHRALLPPSLVDSAPNDSVLRLRVATAGATALYERGVSAAGHLTATDTMPAWLGGLVTTVELRPSVAASLLIGGIPDSRLPMYLLVLAAAVLLAVIALVQLRRGRELARLRSQFVANVSHELRTPLAQISMFSETLMLDRERSPEERRHFLSVIFREARRLTNLVDGVLRFSGGEVGMSRIRPETRDLVSDARETIDAFRPLAAPADVTVRLDAPPEVHAWVDHAAVRQILVNLLDNAVKYGPPGQTITVGIRRETDDVLVSVEDDGVGIPEADRQRVFEPFARLERPGVPRVSGSGIGLSVVRDLVLAHGGRVWVDDGTAGRGTRISFTVRAADARVTEHVPDRAASGTRARTAETEPVLEGAGR